MNFADCSLREAVESDLPAIVAIYNSIIPGRMVTADLEPITVEDRRGWFQLARQCGRPVTVLTDPSGAVVGWQSFDRFFPRAAYDGTAMVAVYIAESHRGRGLGRGLLDAAVARAPALGLHTLLGYIFAHNQPSLRLFEARGFARWAHLPGVAVLDGIPRDLIIVGRRLGNAADTSAPTPAF